ncbi:MAG: ribosome-associated translation inhibitor RaiA [Limisphaerales bacterium]|jgi:ribosome-associated translation inhibitor RaiA
MTIRISWHNLEVSDAVEETILKHYEKLAQFCDTLTSARISLDRPNPSHGSNDQFAVLLELHVPGEPIVVSHNHTDSDHDLYALLHHTFDAARRQLQDYVRIRRGKVKHHEPRAKLTPETVENESDNPDGEILGN